MSISLRPVLRPATLPSLPSPAKSTTYICQSCRHARLLRRPKRPYTFSQLIALSDGSAFMIRTTSPQPVYRSTRDTRNALLWNPSSKELLNVEDDEAGRLAGFRARFGTMFDAKRETAGEENESIQPKPSSSSPSSSEKEDSQTSPQGAKSEMESTSSPSSSDKKVKFVPQTQSEESEWQYEFEEDDANLLDLISSYGQSGPNQAQNAASAPPPPPPAAKGKKGKK